jgi:hypothetical protein
MAVEKDTSIANAQANVAANSKAKAPAYNPLSGNTPDAPKPASTPYNPMSGNASVNVGTNAAGATTYTPVTTKNQDQSSGLGGNNQPNLGTSFTAPDGAKFADQASYQAYVQKYYQNQNVAAANTAAKIAEGQSAFDLLQSEFNQYGLGALVEPLKGLVQSGTTGPALSLALQNTDAYKQRFSANQARIAKGLSALTPAQYIGMEDQYQNIMRQYGLPASYYAKDSIGKQAGFDQLLSNDVSATELNDRISTAQDRVKNANPEVLQQLKVYYPDITNGDILSYALNPANALDALKRKVTAAEIGGAASAAGLSDTASQAEQLAAYGVTGAQAQQQYGNIAQLAQRGNQLSSIYNQQPYGQQQATAEVFNLAGQTDATNQRKKLTALEQAQFSGQAGTAQNAFSRERAISPMMLGVPGAGSF